MTASAKSCQGRLAVCVAGVTGAVGQLLTKAILAQRDFLLTSAVARSAAHRTVGDVRSRGAPVTGTQVHALRLPGMTFGFEIIFGRAHERLTIKHEALTRAEPYVDGTLLAIRNVASLVGVHRGLESVLDLNLQ